MYKKILVLSAICIMHSINTAHPNGYPIDKHSKKGISFLSHESEIKQICEANPIYNFDNWLACQRLGQYLLMVSKAAESTMSMDEINQKLKDIDQELNNNASGFNKTILELRKNSLEKIQRVPKEFPEKGNEEDIEKFCNNLKELIRSNHLDNEKEIDFINEAVTNMRKKSS